jgi:Lon-like ATP-dependent protease
VDGASALTGEVSVRGEVRPVGGVPSKVEAARRAGLRRVLVPRENYMQRFEGDDVEVVPVDTLEEALALMFAQPAARTLPSGEVDADRLVAQGVETRPGKRRMVEA